MEHIGSNDPWAALAEELDAWAAGGRAATFWWRDDDAVAPTAALDRLLELADRHRVPLALAVIPRDAVADLPASVAVLQHGWAHANHAAPPAKKAELGDDRPLPEVTADLAAGRDRLAALFAGRTLPVLTPPWNRIGGRVAAALPGLGFRGLSTFGPRTADDRLVRVNTHADVIDWHGGRRFAGAEAVVGAAVAHLRARRLGGADPAEPTGLLTHHLDHDEDGWDFIDRFFAKTRHHPAAAWRSAEELFMPGTIDGERPGNDISA